jgi:CDP-4-dehydro-6-deoxyglucose reductase
MKQPSHAPLRRDPPGRPETCAMLIRLENSGREFESTELEYVLDAAERAGVSLPYSCRDGICGTCKARLSSGMVDHGYSSPSALSESEREQGYFLMCCSIAQTDLLVDAPIEELGFSPSPVTLTCTVRRIDRPADDVAVLYLDLPNGVPFRFRAGQYVEVLLPDGLRRSFSVANAPQEPSTVELHIRHVPGGRFTPWVFASLKPGDPLTIEGPKGGFYLRKERRPVIFLASGTGFAPIKSIVLYGMRHKLRGPATFYWGGRRPQDLYMADMPAKWVADYPGFHFIPVMSEAVAADGWAGRTGFVHEAVMADFPDLSGHDVYACGVPAMVNAARRDFTGKCGLPPNRFFADLFLTAADRLA